MAKLIAGISINELMASLYPIVVGFLFCFMGVIYNTWGFLLPYVASRVG